MSEGVIYGILDAAGAVRYVGKTIGSPERRLCDHLYSARSGRRTPLACWLRTLTSKPAIVVLQHAPADINAAERRWIADLRPTGRLLNVLDGGDGWTAGRPQPAAAVAARAAALRGRKRSPETIAAMAAAMRGRTHSEETRRRISEARKGLPGRRRVWSEAMVTLLVETYAETGSAERTAALVGVGRRQAFAKLRDLGVLRPRRGRGPQSPESRAKISAAKRRRDALAMSMLAGQSV